MKQKPSPKNTSSRNFQTEAIGLDIETLGQELIQGNRSALARAITLSESSLRKHRIGAEDLLSRVLASAGHSLRIAVSGIPGAGKSTFIERFGMALIEKKHKVAVLAIDPSSERTGGSILGDKTRMQNLSANENAFVRPSPSAGNLGGVAKRTREAIILCEAAGFDVIIIETVGVGQSEIAASKLSDLFLMLAVPGTGDELQGIKRGILEIADIVAVNKTDGNTEKSALKAASEIRTALHILASSTGIETPVCNISAMNGYGMSELIELVFATDSARKTNGKKAERRQKQNLEWLWEEIKLQVFDEIKSHPRFLEKIKGIESQVVQGLIAPSKASRQLILNCLKEQKE